MKVYMNSKGHMTKMAAMAINSIFFLKKNLLLQDQKAFDYEALRNGGLQNLFKS